MKKKSIGILGVVTGVVLVAALLTVQSRSTTKAADDELGDLFEGLTARINDVTEMQIQKGGESLTVRRDGEDWGVVERSGYHAKFDRVKEIMLSIANLAIEEPKTSKPERYASLGVEDPDAEGAESTRVVLRAGSETLADVIVGETLYRQREQSVYARKHGEAQAYLCAGSLTNVGTDPSSWIDRELLRVESKDLVEVRIRHADGEEILLEPAGPGSTSFTLANPPEGREQRHEGVGNQIATSLASLSLDDVRPVAEVDFAADPIATSTFKKGDGETITVESANFDEKVWVRISSTFEAAPLPATVEPPTPDDAAADAVDPAAALAAQQAITSQLSFERNERLSSWAFAIPAYKSKAMAKRMEELLKELPEEEPPAEFPLLTPEEQAEQADEQAAEEAVAEEPAGSDDE